MQFQTKVCPDCDGEFVDQVEVCPDCGTQLAWSTEPDADSDIAPGWVEAQPLEPSPELVVLRTTGVRWAHELMSRLAERGIRARAMPAGALERTVLEAPYASFGHGWSYDVQVRPEDLAAAREVDHELYAEEVPDDHSLRPPHDPSSGVCPACGSTWSTSQDECPSCGLSFRGYDQGDAS